MEAELATLRAQKRETPAVPQFNPHDFVRDPVGFMSRHGIPTEHVTRVLVASALGDQAPPELKVLASLGPQMSATRALEEKFDALSRQLAESASSSKARESAKALLSDKSKYPHLAKAFAADPSLEDEMVAAGGNAEEYAKKMEARLKVVAPAPPPASDANAEAAKAAQDQSAQVQPATEGAPPKGDLPTLTPPGGQWDHDRERDAVLRKHGLI